MFFGKENSFNPIDIPIDQIPILNEIERCHKEADIAKQNGDYEMSFLKLDNARRLQEKLKPHQKTRTVGSE